MSQAIPGNPGNLRRWIFDPDCMVTAKMAKKPVFWPFSGYAPKVKLQNAIDITDLWR
jgi:hypothetical protein